jgi:Lsr2
MAQSVSVIVTDDLDGSEGAQTVTFGFEGISYEIDLSAKNRAKLEKALAPFIAEARRAPRRGRSRAAARPGGGGQPDRAAIRAWARTAGLNVSERGRISAEVIRQYEAAR